MLKGKRKQQSLPKRTLLLRMSEAFTRRVNEVNVAIDCPCSLFPHTSTYRVEDVCVVWDVHRVCIDISYDIISWSRPISPHRHVAGYCRLLLLAFIHCLCRVVLCRSRTPHTPYTHITHCCLHFTIPPSLQSTGFYSHVMYSVAHCILSFIRAYMHTWGG